MSNFIQVNRVGKRQALAGATPKIVAKKIHSSRMPYSFLYYAVFRQRHIDPNKIVSFYSVYSRSPGMQHRPHATHKVPSTLSRSPICYCTYEWGTLCKRSFAMHCWYCLFFVHTFTVYNYCFLLRTQANSIRCEHDENERKKKKSKKE